MTAAIRTVYIVVADRKTGQRVKGVGLKRLAELVRAGMPSGWATRRGGEYITAGTRFLTLGPPYESTPVVKVRGNDLVRSRAVSMIRAAGWRIESITDYAREEVTA